MNVRPLLVACAFLLLALVAAAVADAGDAVALHQAVVDGTVSARVTGLGGSSGDTIEVVLRRRVARAVTLVVAPGTIFRSADPAAQDMAGARFKGERTGPTSYRAATTIVLADDREHACVVEAYCMNFHRANPSTTTSFSIAPPGPGLALLLEEALAQARSARVTQAALWIAREGVDDRELRARFPASAAELVEARAWLARPRPTPSESATSPGTAAPPSSDGRYVWVGKPGWPAGRRGSRHVTVTEVVDRGEHVLSGRAGPGSVLAFGGLEAPDSQDIRIEVDPAIGVTTYCGLAFRVACTAEVLVDRTVLVERAGVEVVGPGGARWVSRATTLDGRTVFAFYPSTAAGPSAPVAPPTPAASPTPVAPAPAATDPAVDAEPVLVPGAASGSFGPGTLLFARGGTVYVPDPLPTGVTIDATVHDGLDLATPVGRTELVRRIIAKVGLAVARAHTIQITTPGGVYRWPR